MKVNEYLSTNKASKLLGICDVTLRNWADTGKIRSYRNHANKRRMFRASDIEEFLKNLARAENGTYHQVDEYRDLAADTKYRIMERYEGGVVTRHREVVEE